MLRVPVARGFLATVLSILSCAALTAGADPAAASQLAAGRVSSASAGRAKRARAGCAKSSARASRRARLAAHACRARARRPRATALATTAASDAATIASVLATPCQNTELTPGPENIALVRAAVLCLINRKRAEDGESPLVTSPQLEQAAEGHCQELIAEDYFAHVSPSGETPVERIRLTGYIPSPSVGYVIGENLAWGTYQLSTPQAIVSAWIASPGHLANILEAQYRETGIGVTPAVPASLAAGAPGATYAQEFGIIIP
jgi:uncharacterized protein YkwD